MTKIKLNGPVANAAQDALTPLTGVLYAKPGMRIMAVVELAHVERTEPAPDEDAEGVVKLGVKHLEVARGEQEHVLREALRALYLHRTAQGKLTEEDDVELAKSTLDLIAGRLVDVENARLKVALERWAEYARQSQFATKLTIQQLREELKTVAEGLSAAAGWSPAP